jgi:hypothetical protein
MVVRSGLAEHSIAVARGNLNQKRCDTLDLPISTGAAGQAKTTANGSIWAAHLLSFVGNVVGTLVVCF